MAKEFLNWGLIGTARINRALIAPLRVSPRNRLLAVASRSAEKASAYARQWEIPKAHGSYEALLDDPEIDVVYNSLPNSMHAEWTIKAAQAGKHVLCEKPLATTLEEVDAIREASQKGGVVVTEAFMYRHHPQTLKVKELVDGGALGEIKVVKGGFSFSLDDPSQTNIRLRPELGGGSIWDIGCYPISYTRYVMDGEPAEVFGWQISNSLGVDLTFAGQMRFANGAIAQFDSSFQTPFHVWMEITGTKGILFVQQPFKPQEIETLVLSRGSETEVIDVQGPELYIGEVEDLADAVLDGKPPRLSLEWSRGNVAAILALLESARKGQPIAL